MEDQAFQNWLDAYAAAWQGPDAEAYLALFSEDARHYQTPFEAPKRGHEGLRAGFEDALGRQTDRRFSFEIIAVEGETGWAKWTASFTREGIADPVRIDGVLKAMFDGQKCCELREWWHRLEPGQGDLMRDFDA